MATTTTNYGFNISEGTDLVNPLVDIFPNWTALDSDLKSVSDRAIGTATELTTGTVHALTRADIDRDVFVFTATSNFTAGDTFTLDGTQVSALTPAGEQLATGCYIIGSDVIVSVHGTLMTMYVSPTKVADSDKLDGHDSAYFATASDLGTTDGNVSSLSSKVGSGVLTTTAQDCVGAINELDADLSWKLVGRVTGSNSINIPESFRELHVVVKCPSANASPLYVIDHLINKIELDNLSTSVNNWLVGGGAVSNTNHFRAITVINASHTTINTSNVVVNNVDYLPYTTTELYYR